MRNVRGSKGSISTSDVKFVKETFSRSIIGLGFKLKYLVDFTPYDLGMIEGVIVKKTIEGRTLYISFIDDAGEENNMPIRCSAIRNIVFKKPTISQFASKESVDDASVIKKLKDGTSDIADSSLPDTTPQASNPDHAGVENNEHVDSGESCREFKMPTIGDESENDNLSSINSDGSVDDKLDFPGDEIEISGNSTPARIDYNEATLDQLQQLTEPKNI